MRFFNRALSLRILVIIVVLIMISASGVSFSQEKWDDFPEWIMSSEDFKKDKAADNPKVSNNALLEERNQLLQQIQAEEEAQKRQHQMNTIKEPVHVSSEPAAKSDSSAPVTGIVTGAGVNCRNAASLYEPVIYQFRQGTYLKILDYSKGWYKVLIEKKITGWIFGKYLKQIQINEPLDLEQSDVFYSRELLEAVAKAFENRTPPLEIGIITGNKVNIRAGAGIDEPFVTKGFKKDVVLVEGEQDNWFKISWLLPREGWVHESLLKELSQIKGRVISNGADIRLGPGEDYDLVRRVLKNMELPVLSRKSDWFLVALPTGQIGYISSESFVPPQSMQENKKETID
jgi:uncharacterized protein YgiM (DUF1202 family)